MASAPAFSRNVKRSEIGENVIARFAAGYVGAGLEGRERFNEGDAIGFKLAFAKRLQRSFQYLSKVSLGRAAETDTPALLRHAFFAPATTSSAMRSR